MVAAPRLDGDTEQRLIARTYFSMRWGLGIAAFLLPVVTPVGEKLLTSHSLPLSISGYYHTGMRNYFVATLMVIAVFLFLYKGFSNLENHLLNVAGFATAIIAFCPTGCDSGATECATFTAPQVHGICALIAFGCIGVVAIFLGDRTLDLLHNAPLEQRFRSWYRALGAAMVVLPVLAAVLALAGGGAVIYWAELGALWVFAGYWMVKTVEFRKTSAEQQAMRGDLPPATSRTGPAINPPQQ